MGSPYGGMPGQGYSYSTLTSSMDLGRVDGPGGRACRSRAMGNLPQGSRPRVDRRYYPPPARDRQATDPSGPSPVYESLQSGLTLPRTAIARAALQPQDPRQGATSKRDKDKAFSRSHHLNSSKPTKEKSKKRQKPEKAPPVKQWSRPRSIAKDGPKVGRSRRPFSIKSTRSRGSGGGRTVTSKKAASQRSAGRSKGRFGWNCFGS